MSSAVVLDAGPLGILTGPPRTPRVLACRAWMDAILAGGGRVFLPEIADYELRREFLLRGMVRSLRALDRLATRLEYLPLETPVLRRAAELWAQARRQGQPTAGDKHLDADVILAAQALSLGDPNMIVATTNVGHLSRFLPADLWENIPTA